MKTYGIVDTRTNKVVNSFFAESQPPAHFPYIYIESPDMCPSFGWDYFPETGTISPHVLSLEEIKDAKKYKMKEMRDIEEVSGFMYREKKFDSDANSMKRLSSAIDAARSAATLGIVNFKIEWTCANGYGTIELLPNDFVMLPITIANAGNALHMKYRNKKAEIENCISEEEVDAIVWE